MTDTTLAFATTRHLEAAYLDSRVGDRTCLLVHGWPDDAMTWSPVAALLEERGVRAVRPYLRGFGPTRFRDPAARHSGQLAALALDLIDFIEALDLRDFVLVGHDWGARIGYMAATRLADRIRGLVCLSVGYGPNSAEQVLGFEQARLYWYHWYFATERGRAALAADPKSFARQLWRHWSPSYVLDEAEWQTTARSFENPDWVDIAIDSYRHRWGFVDGDPQLAADEAFFARCPPIAVPTVVLHGDEDGATLPHMSEHKERFFTAGYTRRVLRGIGHFVPREDPAGVVGAIFDCFDR